MKVVSLLVPRVGAIKGQSLPAFVVSQEAISYHAKTCQLRDMSTHVHVNHEALQTKVV